MLSRRKFLGGLAATTALAPLVKIKRARGAGTGGHVVIVGIGGGLRLNESLGMAEGATMPNLFGTTPIVSGFASGTTGAPRIAPEYAALARPLALPTARTQPLHTLGTLITNLRYADGPPGHLQGQGCLLSGFYNRLENRADAHLPVPTIFELYRRATNAPATDAWYISMVGGFYRALIASDNVGYGPKYAGIYLQPPGAIQPFVPIITSGQRTVNVTQSSPLPTIPADAAEDAAAAKLTAMLDASSPPWADDDPLVHLTPEDNARVQAHLSAIYSDSTYQSFFPDTFGIGLAKSGGGVEATNDAKTIYHAERVLQQFKPAVLGVTLLDIDVCHQDFNGYLRGQQIADACVNHLWNFIQADPALRDNTTMIVLPEHGRHLFMNGNNPDSYGRSGIDHGQGDNGDRDVWMLALGPTIKQNQVIAPTGIAQAGRSSGRYETIDAVMTAAAMLGLDTTMAQVLGAYGARPGMVIHEVLR